MRHTGTLAKQIGPGITSVRTWHSGLKNHIARLRAGTGPNLQLLRMRHRWGRLVDHPRAVFSPGSRTKSNSSTAKVAMYHEAIAAEIQKNTQAATIANGPS